PALPSYLTAPPPSSISPLSLHDALPILGHFIFTGILERFPKLRLAILESNAGWLPFWLGRMDDHTHGRNSVMGKSEKLRMRPSRSEEHTSELQSRFDLVCRLLLEKKKTL